MAVGVGVMLISSPRCLIGKLIKANSVISRLHFAKGCRYPFFYESTQAFMCTSSAQLAERRYSKKHEWVSVNGKIGTVGISQYAQESLGDVVYVQLPEINSDFAQDDECGAVESVKAASEIYIPVSGRITEVNKELEDNPALVNQSCYDKGWLFRVEMKQAEEYEELLSEEQYNRYLKTLE